MTFKEETEDVITMKSCCSKVKKNERRNERRTRICVYKPILLPTGFNRRDKENEQEKEEDYQEKEKETKIMSGL